MEQTLGKRIVSNRKRMGLTQDQLAEKLGVTAQAVSKWENDQSCPDIAMLPRLAEIFGTSIDALLGIAAREEAPVHQAEVVTEDTEPEGVHFDNGKWEFKYDVGHKGGIFLAIWVLIVGGLLLASNLLQWQAGFWDILWPSGLLIFGLSGLYPEFSVFRLGCGLFGGYFLLNNLGALPFALGKELLLPVSLLLFGLSLLVDALQKKNKPEFRVFHHGKPLHEGEKRHTTHLTQEGSRFECSTSFGEDHHRIDLERLTEGEASVSFGELTVDLSGCKEIADNCTICVECAFGNLELMIPRYCRLEQATDTAFGAISVKGEPAPDAAVSILLSCDVSFGEVTLRYI